MGPIEFATAAVLIIVIFTIYKAMTHRLALEARSSLVPEVRDIMNDPNSSDELKRCVLGAFHASASPGFIPWLLRQPKARQEKSQPLDGEHAKVIGALMREHFFKINLLAAPHWYAIVAVVFFVIVILAMPFYLISYFRARVFRVLSDFEKKILDPRFPTNNIKAG